MGKADAAVKNWLGDKRRFADLFNGVLFGGEQVLTENSLEELKGESDIILRNKDEKDKTLQRYRDIVMRWSGGADFVLLAAEVQDKIHYAMPVKNMLYDSISYAEQVKRLWKKRMRDKAAEGQGISTEEFLSGFRKEDRIYPVITLVFYYDEKEWDGAEDLYGLMGLSRMTKRYPQLKKYIPNYHINLVNAGDIGHLERFRTDLQEVFGMLKYRKDKNGLRKYIKEHQEYFAALDVDSYYAVSVFLKSERLIKQLEKRGKDKKGDLDMCEALEELYKDGVEEGINKGLSEGLSEGINRGKREAACNLKRMGMAAEQIAEAVGENVAVVRKWLKEMSDMRVGDER